MLRKILIGALALVIVAGAAAWFNRHAIILFMASNTGKFDVGPHQDITWDAGPVQAQTPINERAPNIIFILADDLGMNDISTFGGGVAGGRVRTPNIDRLAASGALFEQAYAGTATCAPSRAMLMTGRYPTRTGFEFTPTPEGMGRIVTMIGNDSRRPNMPRAIFDQSAARATPPFNDQGLPGSEVTIAEMLRGAGYHTVHIGKWHLGSGPEFGPNAQGFDESLLMASGLHLPDGDPRGVSAKLDFDPIDRFLWARMQFAASFNEGPVFEPGGYLADYWTDESLRVIEANRNRPFFLYLAHWGVHTPLQAMREDYEAVGDIAPHRLRVYAAMVRALDRSVGRILDKLEEEGLAENTIVVFSSDNGGAGYVGLSDVNAPYRGWKATFFEGGIRVPLFVRWPARIEAGRRIAAPVAHIDVAPTLAAAAGAAVPQGVAIDGRNLLPLALGENDAPPHDALFWQSGHYRVVRQGDWKLQVSARPNRAWLYNLAEDPTEETNLADREPARVAAMRALIDRHLQGARAPLYPYSVELPVSVDSTLADPFNEGDDYIYWPN
ncbi:MAG: sulfatase-like hydrolase/transferase [Alphaproteobacteria bacterium]|nr:sulfatase-like hydrolase/transferase [Alphaproteobacteria bacterium]